MGEREGEQGGEEEKREHRQEGREEREHSGREGGEGAQRIREGGEGAQIELLVLVVCIRRTYGCYLRLIPVQAEKSIHFPLSIFPLPFLCLHVFRRECMRTLNAVVVEEVGKPGLCRRG